MFLNVICKFLLIHLKVCMYKISDKYDKFLLNYSNFFWVHFFPNTVFFPCVYIAVLLDVGCVIQYLWNSCHDSFALCILFTVSSLCKFECSVNFASVLIAFYE